MKGNPSVKNILNDTSGLRCLCAPSDRPCSNFIRSTCKVPDKLDMDAVSIVHRMATG